VSRRRDGGQEGLSGGVLRRGRGGEESLVRGGMLRGSSVGDFIGAGVDVIPRSEEGTKPSYVCLECSNHTYSNNMITRFHVQ
jgi:hypothetical protein